MRRKCFCCLSPSLSVGPSSSAYPIHALSREGRRRLLRAAAAMGVVISFAQYGTTTTYYTTAPCCRTFGSYTHTRSGGQITLQTSVSGERRHRRFVDLSNQGRATAKRLHLLQSAAIANLQSVARPILMLLLPCNSHQNDSEKDGNICSKQTLCIVTH